MCCDCDPVHLCCASDTSSRGTSELLQMFTPRHIWKLSHRGGCRELAQDPRTQRAVRTELLTHTTLTINLTSPFTAFAGGHCLALQVNMVRNVMLSQFPCVHVIESQYHNCQCRSLLLKKEHQFLRQIPKMLGSWGIIHCRGNIKTIRSTAYDILHVA